MNTYDMIFLADDEWNIEVMERIARDWFTTHPLCQFVEVHEHAGWWLGYRRDLSICGTANDRAVLDHGPRPQEFSGVCYRRTLADSAQVKSEENRQLAQLIFGRAVA